MMKRALVVGACLGASLATGFAVATAAFAESSPALYECAKVKVKGSGKYNKGCLVEGKHGTGENGYEIKEGFGKGKTFKAKGGGANLEVPGIGGIDCVKSAATAHFTSPTTGADVVATFGDCEYDGHKCVSSGAATGTIVTEALKGIVGYLAGKGTGSPKVGVVFSPEVGEILAAFDCGQWDFSVTGATIAEVTPVNKFGKEAVFSFRQKALGEQEWQYFEEGPKETLSVHVCDDCADPTTEGTGITSDEELIIKAKIEALELKA